MSESTGGRRPRPPALPPQFRLGKPGVSFSLTTQIHTTPFFLLLHSADKFTSICKLMSVDR